MSAPGATAAPAARRRWFRDWRVWLGVVITVACGWYMLRGVPLSEVIDAMSQADLLPLLGLSIPAYVLSVWLRALRWRHLTNPIVSIDRPTLFRAQAIGFMVNNLAPLRIGELVRSWYLARETRTSGASILATVVLERVLDMVSIPLIAALALALMSTGADQGGMIAQGSMILAGIALLPLVALVLLRVAPERILAVVRFFAQPFPEHMGRWLEGTLRRFTSGLGALSGGRHLFWIVLHTVVIWLGTATVPIVAAVWAFHLDFGGALQTLAVCWLLLGATGVAVAIPSAPGFFGPYQIAYLEVLELYGVDSATALGIGLVVWFIFWASLTIQGLVVMRLGRRSLTDLTRGPSKDPTSEDR